MRSILEELLWALTKVFDLGGQCIDLEGVGELGEVHVLLQGVRLKEIIRELRTIASLQVAEDQIDPFMEVGTHMVAFKRISILHDEVLVAWGPSRQADVANFLLKMIKTKLKFGFVFHERAIAKVELWD